MSNILCTFAAAKVGNTIMTTLSHSEKEAIMADMKSFDEPMPAVGIFWYDPEERTDAKDG